MNQKPNSNPLTYPTSLSPHTPPLGAYIINMFFAHFYSNYNRLSKRGIIWLLQTKE